MAERFRERVGGLNERNGLPIAFGSPIPVKHFDGFGGRREELVNGEISVGCGLAGKEAS